MKVITEPNQVRRMALAKNLLRGERPSLADVADRVGYQSASAFSTAFTRLTGRSPSEFARDENSIDADMR
ncbi:MAG TPA: AraC family transcriptional regulator [Pyrinomonadaceae bacterium]|nr:AraC family transcriptional regulator [Pyrinomonadaceae bacterium]